jgi:hypothetical protein
VTTFTVGDRVRSRVDTQSMAKGVVYEVAAVVERPSPFGTFVIYVLRDVDGTGERTIVNGHLVLDRA